MKLSPLIRPEPIVSKIHEELRSAILSGQFEPGERLVEARLSELLQVSRTPIRTALSRLEFDGLAVPSIQGGLEVADFIEEITEIYGLRERVEGFAANVAASRISSEQLSALEQIVRETARLGSSGEYSERSRLNREFHLGIATATGSSRIANLVESLYVYSLNPKTLETRKTVDTVRHQQQHEVILAALQDCDAEAAETAVRIHLKDLEQLVAAHLPS